MLDNFNSYFAIKVIVIVVILTSYMQLANSNVDNVTNSGNDIDSDSQEEKGDPDLLNSQGYDPVYEGFLPNYGFYQCHNLTQSTSTDHHHHHQGQGQSPLRCVFVDPKGAIQRRQAIFNSGNSNFHNGSFPSPQTSQNSPRFSFISSSNPNSNFKVIEGVPQPPPIRGSAQLNQPPLVSSIPSSGGQDPAQILEGSGVFDCNFQPLQTPAVGRRRLQAGRSNYRHVQGVGRYACYFKGIRKASQTFLHGHGQFACNFTRFPGQSQPQQARGGANNINVNFNTSPNVSTNIPEIVQGVGPYQCTFNLPNGPNTGQGAGIPGALGGGGGLPPATTIIPPPFKPNLEQVVLPNVKQKEGFIQGTGQFQCNLQGAFLGVQFIQSVGYYRCVFRGARKTRGFIEGVGYFQLIYQKPGQLQAFVQGIGNYQCNFQASRHFHGFVNSMGHPINSFDGTIPGPISDSSSSSSFSPLQGFRFRQGGQGSNASAPASPHPLPPVIPPPGIAIKTSYLDLMFQYFSGLGNPASRNGQPGQLQVLGNYQHDIDGLGNHPDFGSIQAIEFYNLDLSIADLGPDDQTEFGQRDFVSQQGQLQYSFTADEANKVIASDVTQFVANLGYNFRLVTERDETFFLYIGRYEYESDGPDVPYDPDHDHDIIQGMGSYKFRYPPDLPPNFQSHLEALITYQFDYARVTPDFLQMVGIFEQNYTGFDPADLMYLKLMGTFQKGFLGGTADEFLEVIFTFTYSLPGDGKDAGFFQLYSVYDYLINHPQDSNGYLQLLSQYAFNYVGPGANIGTLQIQLQYQYNFPEFPTSSVQTNHGYFQVLGKWKLDLFYMGIEEVPSFLQVVLIFECSFEEGSTLSDDMCFIQLYCLYQGNTLGIDHNPNAYGQLVGQYYREL